MLYATTRSAEDLYTAQRALSQQEAPDGGFYVPNRQPVFSPSQIRNLKDYSFQEAMAEVLNLLFQTRLTSWDLEFAIGRNPVRLEKVGRRTLAGERWHNTAWTFEGMVGDVVKRIQTQQPEDRTAGPWAAVGTGIASLFGIFAELLRAELLQPEEKLDVAVASGNLCSAVSAWMARDWGLPIGKVVCGCRRSGGLWDLLHNGEMRTSADQTGGEPVRPQALELLLYACGGRQEVQRYLQCAEFGSCYVPGELTLRKLRKGMAVSVISEYRELQTVPSVYSTHHYLLPPQGARAYAGLLDYRAVTGESGWGMVLCDRAPGLDTWFLSQALKLSTEETEQILRKL